MKTSVGSQLDLLGVTAAALDLGPHRWNTWYVPNRLDAFRWGKGRWVSACEQCGTPFTWYAEDQICLGAVGELMRHREPVPARWSAGFAERMRVGCRGWAFGAVSKPKISGARGGVRSPAPVRPPTRPRPPEPRAAPVAATQPPTPKKENEMTMTKEEHKAMELRTAPTSAGQFQNALADSTAEEITAVLAEVEKSPAGQKVRIGVLRGRLNRLQKAGGPSGAPEAVKVAETATAPAEPELPGLIPSALPGKIGFTTIKPEAICPSPTNPRKHFDEAAMAELIESVRRHGVMQPLLVRKNPRVFGPEQYELVAGERRWRAAKAAGLHFVPVTIRELSDEDALELQAIENLQRQDLSPMEEAAGYQVLLKLPGYNMAKLVARTGRKESTIYGKLKLLDLPEPAKAAVQAGTLTPSVAELIARASANVRGDLSKRILKGYEHGWDGTKRPLTFQEAKRAVDEVEEDAKRARAYEAAAVKARGEGLTVLPAADANRVMPYSGGQLQHNCGYVLAAEKCPDDPKGRTYGKILVEGEASGVERFACINDRAVVFEILRRDQVVPALKRLKIWRAEGSKALRQKEIVAAEKQRAAAKKAKDQAAVATLVAAIERSGPGRLPVSFWKQLAAELPMLISYGAEAVTARRGLTHPRKGDIRLVAELAAENDGGVAVGLVAEMVVGSFEHHGFSDRLDRLNQSLGILPEDVAGAASDSSADVRCAGGEVSV